MSRGLDGPYSWNSVPLEEMLCTGWSISALAAWLLKMIRICVVRPRRKAKPLLFKAAMNLGTAEVGIEVSSEAPSDSCNALDFNSTNRTFAQISHSPLTKFVVCSLLKVRPGRDRVSR